MVQDIKKDIIMDLINHKDYKPMKIKEIAIILQIPKSDRLQLEETLDALIREGKLMRTQKGKYKKPDKQQDIVGKYIANPKGFGFVEVEGMEADIFIPGRYSNGAFHGDTVSVGLIRSAEGGRRMEGEVKKVIARGMSEVIGTYQKVVSYGFVIPDNKKISRDIFIPNGLDMDAMNGHKVVVKMINFGDETRKPEGEIIEIIGHITDPSTDILSIVRSMEIPFEFSEEVLDQVEHIPSVVAEEDKSGRLDLRALMTVTIDGEDAKDLDDAITIEKTDKGFTLGVHIADVSHYVTENSPLDKSAINRGTSVYLVDRVIPMLPRKLSNGLCSLNQGEDRLALSCLMDIDYKGNVIGHKIAETLINVDRRMTYTNVRKILTDKDPEVMNTYEDFLTMFSQMEQLASILHEKRKRRGSIDFDFPEAKILLNDKGEPVEIKAYERNVATRIIEEFMLLANETIAENYFWQQIPFVYRTHDEPDPEKIHNLGQFIYNFGYHIKGKEDVHPKEIQKLLYDIEGTKEEAIISRLTLRSMKKAMYTTSNDGHYGLATKYYCHFTSPIRRYPDLQIHRIIKENLQGRLNEKRLGHYDAILEGIAKQCSDTERRAEEAEREVEKLKKVEYMSKRIGEEYIGVISGVTKWGIYIELENTIEGMVHVNNLMDDHYIFSETNHSYLGQMTKKSYQLGDVVKIRVEGASKETRTIDFSFVGYTGN